MVDFQKKIRNSDKLISYLPSIPLDEVSIHHWGCCGIYQIKNKKNGKLYIGQALNIKKRLLQHISTAKRSAKLPIHLAINKYGIDCFEVTILASVNLYGKSKDTIKTELNALEQFYIELYDSYTNGYNATIGGDCGRLGQHHSEQTKLKMKRSAKGYKPKCAKDAQKPVFGYDLQNKRFIDGESVADVARKCGVDTRSVSYICNNTTYTLGGRFIAHYRFLFSFEREDLVNRINWYFSKNYKPSRGQHKYHG